MAVPAPKLSSFNAPQFDADLIRRMSQSGPRYTSYPTADRFTDNFQAGDYLDAVARVRASPKRKPLSLYLHIPFCESLCYYCGCNKIITTDHAKADVYLDYLKREVAMQAQLFAANGASAFGPFSWSRMQ